MAEKNILECSICGFKKQDVDYCYDVRQGKNILACRKCKMDLELEEAEE